MSALLQKTDYILDHQRSENGRKKDMDNNNV